MAPQISIILHANDANILLKRTVDALEQAAAVALSHSVTIELTILLDAVDQNNREWFVSHHSYTIPYRLINISADWKASIDKFIKNTSGQFILLLKNGDIVSGNLIYGLYEAALSNGPHTISHPEYTVILKQDPIFFHFPDEPDLIPFALVESNPFLSRLLIPRSMIEEYQPTRYRDPHSASAFWPVLCHAFANGGTISIAAGTIVFLREESAVVHGVGDELDGTIGKCNLFEPEKFHALHAASYRKLRTRKDLTWDTTVARRQSEIEEIYRTEIDRMVGICSPFTDRDLFNKLRKPSSEYYNTKIGEAFYELCNLLRGNRFTDIVLLPFLTRGGGEQYILNVLNALEEIDSSRSYLFLSGQGGVVHEWLDRLPYDSIFIDLFNRFPALASKDIDLLTLRIIHAVGGSAVLHLKGSDYAQRFFSAYGQYLPMNRSVFYRFSDPRGIIANTTLINGFSFSFAAEYAEKLSLIITDTKALQESDLARLDVYRDKWACLYSYCPTPNVGEAILPWEERRRRLLWLSRLEPEKRPSLLAEIATALESSLPDVCIDVWGSSPSGHDLEYLAARPNIRMRGAFHEMSDVRPRDYGAFIYTTAYDGLPNVVLEMMSIGLTVIAPSIGGIPEAIEAGVNGILIDDYEDDDQLVAAYLKAITWVLASEQRGLSLGAAAAQRVKDQHGRRAFVDRVRALFPIHESAKFSA